MSIVAASSVLLSPFAAVVAVSTPTPVFAQQGCDLAGSWKTTHGPMRLALPEGHLSGLIASPSGLESLRGVPGDAGFEVTIVNAAGASLTGTVVANGNCSTLSGTVGSSFIAKRLTDISREEVVDPAAVAEMSQALSVAGALFSDVASHVVLSPNDPDVLLAEVGNSPEALREWVGSETLLLSYQGALRSPDQVLADRWGNALDRARLLAALLGRVGVTARLAHGQLAKADLSGLYDMTRRNLPQRPDLLPEYDLADLEHRVPGADVQAIAADAQALAATGADPTQDTLRILESLAPLVQPAGGSVPQLSADYWWVEYNQNGIWTPLVPDPAVALPVLRETMAPDQLPEELFHRLTVKVISETVDSEGKLAESEVYSGSIRAEAAAAGDLMLTLLPGDVNLSIGAPEILDQADEALDAIAAEPTWMPILSIDGEISGDKVLLMDGRTLTPDETVALGLGKKLFAEGGANDFLSGTGGLLGNLTDILNGTTPAPAVEDRLTALYLTYIIDMPGEPTRVERRTIWDRFDAEMRATGPTSILPLAPELKLARAGAFSEARHIAVRTFQERDESLVKRFAELMSTNVERMQTSLMSYASGAAPDNLPETDSAAVAPIIFEMERRSISQIGTILMVQRPDIVTYVSRTATALKGPFPESDLQIDIVQSGYAPLWFGVDTFGVGLQEGIAVTLAEANASDRGLPVRNTARAYLKSLDEAVPWRVYRTPRELTEHPVPIEIAALVAAELARGNIVVSPTQPIALETLPWSGYWRVDPRTGETLGMDPNGGATLTEYLTRLHGYLSSFKNIKQFATTGNLIVRGVTLFLCVGSFALSDKGGFATAMLLLCLAGESLNVFNGLRAANKLAAAEAQAATYARAAALSDEGLSVLAWEAIKKGVEKMAPYAGTVGTQLDEVYALFAVFGNAMKAVAGTLGIADKLLKKK